MKDRPSEQIVVQSEELKLKFVHGEGERQLSFAHSALTFDEWRVQTRQKLKTLLGLQEDNKYLDAKILRSEKVTDVKVSIVLMTIDETLSIPAYLLIPDKLIDETPVMAIHGHGEAEACIGVREDYHHSFALTLAQNGYIVLCPELRGFGSLKDMAQDISGSTLDYWNWGRHMAYSLVSESFLHGSPLIGQTVSDLLRWEEWLCNHQQVKSIYVAGISYGGDLALLYPVFSPRTKKIFASGTLGSMSVIFSQCYNAPAHGIPGILKWMDRSDIAGLNAPIPLAIHYGELDVPGPENFSASFNDTVASSIEEVRQIYHVAGNQSAVALLVSKGKKHEMDIEALLQFLA